MKTASLKASFKEQGMDLLTNYSKFAILSENWEIKC